jgi:small subunit ribosomal protein S2
VLFVGTKRQAQETIHDEALRAGMPYVTNRWLGGMLTNWSTIRQRVNELDQLERMRDKGDFERITKKEALNLTRRIERLEYMLGGIRDMNQLPSMVFVVDVRREDTAIHEANLLEIPVVAMVDTNCDPRVVDYVIPSNDDAIRAIKLIVGRISDAVVEGRAMRKDLEEEQEPVTQVVMSGIDEQELTDEELLGAATLAKITASQEAMAAAEIETKVVEDESGEVLEEVVVEEIEAQDSEPISEVEDEADLAEVAAEEIEIEEVEAAAVVEEAEEGAEQVEAQAEEITTEDLVEESIEAESSDEGDEE